MPRKSVVLVSGGADSTYAALRELRETDHEVHLHHHCYQFGFSDVQHDRMERIALMAMDRLDNYIIPKMKKDERKFTFTRSASDYSDLPADSKPNGQRNQYAHVGGYVCCALGASRLVTGHRFGSQGSVTGDNTEERERIFKLFLAHFGAHARFIPKDIEWNLPAWDYDNDQARPKGEIWDYLGDYAELTSSCLNPKRADDGVWEQCDNRWLIERQFKGKPREPVRCWQCDATNKELGRIPDVRKV